jgi:sugar fermentation stimulation protein A
MKIASGMIPGKFLRRANRFLASVELAGEETWAHVRSSARMAELLVPGRRVFLSPAGNSVRKTGYTLLLVQFGDIRVSVDATLPNRLIHEALQRGEIDPFMGYRLIRREAVHGNSRFDFHLQDPGECLVEVKSVTLVRNGVAMFPDAPSSRGRKHMEELAAAVETGIRGAVVFVVQREDGESFAPNDEADPNFGQALRNAAARGVEIYALGCAVRNDDIRWERWIPVRL